MTRYADLLADVDGMVSDPLETAGDGDHPQPPLEPRRIGAEGEHLADDAAVRAVDQLVEVDERVAPRRRRAGESIERDTDHPLGPRAHVGERVDERGPGSYSVTSLTSFAIVTQ